MPASSAVRPTGILRRWSARAAPRRRSTSASSARSRVGRRRPGLMGGPQQRSVLAVLAVGRGRRSIGELIDRLWPRIHPAPRPRPSRSTSRGSGEPLAGTTPACGRRRWAILRARRKRGGRRSIRARDPTGPLGAVTRRGSRGCELARGGAAFVERPSAGGSRWNDLHAIRSRTAGGTQRSGRRGAA